MTIQDIYVLGAARTPMGGLMGALSGVSAADLGGAAIAAALARAGVTTEGEITESVKRLNHAGISPLRPSRIDARTLAKSPP